MSVRVVGETRLGKRVVFGLVGALVLALVVEFLAGGLAGQVTQVYAGVCGIINTCPGGDTTRTSVLTVNHVYDPESTNSAVEPDDTDTFTITGVWSTPSTEISPCVCEESTASVTVDVTWSDANHTWTATCTGCNALSGPIYSVGVCTAGSWCGSPQIDNSSSYKLYVDASIMKNQFCPS